jgi:hypothetical protein
MGALHKKPDSVWKKIGPCLYRYAPSGIYYGLIKSAGKQIRRSLDTTDFPHARRKLQELRRDIALTDPELAQRTLESQAEGVPPDPFGHGQYALQHSRFDQAAPGRWPKGYSPHHAQSAFNW